jgi:putative hydrolase of the HAD superfamily
VNHLPHPRAVFLDLDDTILDDSSAKDSAWATVCEAHAPNLELAAADLRLRILEVRDWYWSDPDRHRAGRADLRAAGARIVGEALRRLDRGDPTAATAIANAYRDLRDASIEVLPGAIEALERMHGQGLALGLLTNGGALAQRTKIDRFDLARHFDYICIEGEFGCGKPDDRVYAAALQALNIAPSETWMAGDNLEWDVAAPMRQGIWGIWVDPAGRGLPDSSPAKPDLTVRSIAELFS